jgi:drug/metabolite transporter (DMT)-like permease
VLLPLALRGGSRIDRAKVNPRVAWLGGGLAGLVLFVAASLQQVGLLYTTPGNAGFITGLYVVIVPFLGLFVRQKTNLGTWGGAALAAVGMYLLCITEGLTISRGDLLQLAGAFFWAIHVLIIGWLTTRMPSLRLAVTQYAVCAALSMIVALIFETISLHNIQLAAGPILYGGVMSVGVAYTLQVVAQKKAHPAHVAILLSLEAVFAVIGGWLWSLEEAFTVRKITGCTLMLAGMLLSQLYGMYVIKKSSRAACVVDQSATD